jgi:hypothetical protein
LIADIRADCQTLANARSELGKLKPPAAAEPPVAPGQPPPAPAPAPAPPDAATAQRIAALEAKIRELESSPFTPWCEGLPTKTATCDELATLTEIEVAGLVDRKPEDQQALDAKAESTGARPRTPAERAVSEKPWNRRSRSIWRAVRFRSPAPATAHKASAPSR